MVCKILIGMENHFLLKILHFFTHFKQFYKLFNIIFSILYKNKNIFGNN